MSDPIQDLLVRRSLRGHPRGADALLESLEHGPTGTASVTLSPGEVTERPHALTVGIAAAAVLGAVAVIVGSLAGTSETTTTTAAESDARPDADAAPSAIVGAHVPDLAGPSLLGGGFDIGEHRGTPVLISFFAPWCVPCVENHAEVAELRQRFSDKLVVVTVAYDSTQRYVREFFEDRGASWPLIHDPGGRIADRFNVAGVPDFYLVDSDGTVASHLVGSIDADELQRQVRELTTG